MHTLVTEESWVLIGQLELNIRLRSGHVVKDLMQKELMRLKSVIVQIREQEQLLVTTNVMFQAPMTSLRVLAFSLARKPNDQTTLQNAVRKAPNLEYLQIYVDTAVTAQRALNFVGVLPELPKVKSLRPVTKGNAICLPVECLQHVTLLDLGTQVSFIQTPPQLCNLTLEKLDLEYESYPAMMSTLCKSGSSLSVSLSSFTYAALPFLPVTLDKLSLLNKLPSGAESVENMIALPLALARLSGLRALYLADFLTGSLLARLSAGHFPKLHTLGISSTCQESNEYQSVDRNTGNVMIRPTRSLLRLVQYKPGASASVLL